MTMLEAMHTAAQLDVPMCYEQQVAEALVAAFRAGRAAGIGEAAAFAEVWGPTPPNPHGRRAQLAKDMRALIEKGKS